MRKGFLWGKREKLCEKESFVAKMHHFTRGAVSNRLIFGPFLNHPRKTNYKMGLSSFLENISKKIHFF
jgi:hypothetical protein